MPLLDTTRWLITAGVTLLAIAALTGFLQARHAAGSPSHVLWRVAHSGGTAGAVQLIALGAALQHLRPAITDSLASVILSAVTLGTWAFFIGPLLRASGAERASRVVNLAGACIAGPAYLALPLLVLPT
jgi:uncharacterized membrane protein YqhA